MSPKRHPGVLLAGLLALVAGLVPGSAAAQPGDQVARSFESAPLPGRVDVAVKPLGLAGQRPVEVVVKLAGDPVAVEQAKAGTKLAADRKRAVKEGLRLSQSAVEGALRARGARVLTSYQAAINGIRVSVPAGRVAELASLPGVVGVLPIAPVRPDNAVSVPLIGAPAVWDGAGGLRGEGKKIAIIDTGIDYTHANFGGPGTVAAFQQANAASTLPADPALFGPAAPKVKGGIDLVGDAYDASSTDPAALVPHPDPNPLDCAGHGSHVAGTAAGFGVRQDGTRFPGPYDAATHANPFRIGPGVAPLADLYAVRVFGCVGSTNVVVDALDWAVDNDMDVVNMSLGSPFGRPDDASAEASNNAVLAGVVVVASAGNSGASPYITGAPAAGTRAISVAANDATPGFPGASLALGGSTLTAINANGGRFADGASFPVLVLRSPTGGVSLGCSEAEYASPAVAGKLVVTLRGVCARVDRAVFGSRHGAAAVVMINNTADLPPFEGDIFDPASGATVARTSPPPG